MNKSKIDRERRRYPRYSANCHCWVEQDSVTLFGVVTNMSAQGLFLQTLPLVETGAEIRLRITVPDMGDVQATGRIRWKNNTPQKRPEGTLLPGLGIEFSQIHTGQEVLPRYIERRSLVPPPANDGEQPPLPEDPHTKRRV